MNKITVEDSPILTINLLLKYFVALINVLLYSRVVSAVIVFTFGYTDARNQAKSLVDPYILCVKNGDLSPQIATLKNSGQSVSLSTIVLQSLGPKGVSDDARYSPIQRHLEKTTLFFQLSALYSDLSLVEGLYVRAPSGNAGPVQEPRTKMHDKAQSHSPSPEAGFIVPDAVTYNELRCARQAQIQQIGAHEYSAQRDEDDPRTLNFQWLINSISPESMAPGETTSTPDLTVRQASDKFQAIVEGKDSSNNVGIQTL